MYKPWTGPLDARIMIVGEFPSGEELQKDFPLVGSIGFELDKMLGEAGIARNACRVGNVIHARPPSDDIRAFLPTKAAGKGLTPCRGKPATQEVHDGIRSLIEEISRVKPTMIIAVGATALWALTGNSSVMNWRGSMLAHDLADCPPARVLPIIHPTTIQRSYDLRSITVQDLRRAARWSREASWPERRYDFTIQPTLAEVLEFIAELRAAARPFACDIETTGRNISLIALANSPDRALCIPLMTRHSPDGCCWTPDEEWQIVQALRGLMEDPACGVIGQNFHYDSQYFVRHLGIWPRVVDDTMWIQHQLYPGTPKSLDYLASIYCRQYVYWKDELKDYRALPDDEDKFRNYNCEDACRTYEIWLAARPLITRMGLERPYLFQLSLFDPVLSMMIRGIRINPETREALREQISQRMSWLASQFESIVGLSVGTDPAKTARWYRSPKQLQTLFYDEMGLKPIINRKTGKPSVDDEALTKISLQRPEIAFLCEWLQEFSSLDTFVGTFLDAKVDGDGRMRCSYNVAGPETFRFSSSQNAFGSGLNLQNIPRETPEYNVREMFVPDPGHTILDFDLASADLRVVIKESGARALQEILDRGDDVYGTLAAKMDGSEYIGKKHPARQTMKNVAHALDYVGGARTISATYGLPLKDVDRTKAWYFKENPEIPAWHRRIERDLRGSRRVRNQWGYIRTYFDRVDTLLSKACAWVGQSTVGITINKGLMNLWRDFPQVEILMQVHDSLVIQIPTPLATPEFIRRIRDALLVEIPYPSGPLVIPVGCKLSDQSWGAAKDYNV